MLGFKHKRLGYDNSLELYLSKIEDNLLYPYKISKRSIALLLLEEDKDIIELVRLKDGERIENILQLIKEAKALYSQPISFILGACRQKESARIVDIVMKKKERDNLSFRDALNKITMDPFAGSLLLALFLYYGLYKFVGHFGAGVLVDFLEVHVFTKYITPFMTNMVETFIPMGIFHELFVGDYGIITLGLRYAFAIILPIVAVFFFVFAIMEDSGYLPRLAMLVDHIFKKIGLSGRAVIPLVLGFGCSTMATLVTRTLPTKRERVIATLLLSLAIPCSAQMGVILALLSDNILGLFIWLGVIMFVLLLVGFLAAKIMPGEFPSFYMEIPPLRFPNVVNVFKKTFVRLKWYFMEILPLFILGSVIIWIAKITQLFSIVLKVLEYPVRWIGLPNESSVAFLFGFFRRDYGAAGLYDLKKMGLLSGNQLVVSCITLTLFLPCVAQLMMNIKERGLKTGIGMSIFILFFSFVIGFLVNGMLNIFMVRI